MVNNPEGWSRISIEYEKPNLKVFVFDHVTLEFVHCFSMEIVLDYEGYFLISASSGDFNPYFTQIDSFKLFDPKVYYKAPSDAIKDKQAKSRKEGLSQIINNRVSDLIHTRAVKTGDELERFNRTQLMNQVAVQDYYIRPTLKQTEDSFNKLRDHFAQISDTLRGQQLWDNNQKISKDLFQSYFQMSVAVAKEIMFLQNKMEDIKDLQRKKDLEQGRDPTQSAR